MSELDKLLVQRARRIAQLEAALLEAMEWDWLSDPEAIPMEIRERLNVTLGPRIALIGGNETMTEHYPSCHCCTQLPGALYRIEKLEAALREMLHWTQDFCYSNVPADDVAKWAQLVDFSLETKGVAEYDAMDETNTVKIGAKHE